MTCQKDKHLYRSLTLLHITTPPSLSLISFFPVKMSSAYGHIHKPNSDFDLNSILPIRKVLKDGQIGYIQKVDVNNKPLVSYLHQRFNKEIEDG